LQHSQKSNDREKEWIFTHDLTPTSNPKHSMTGTSDAVANSTVFTAEYACLEDLVSLMEVTMSLAMALLCVPAVSCCASLLITAITPKAHVTNFMRNMANRVPYSYWLHVIICIAMAITIITVFAVYGDGTLEGSRTWRANATTHEILEGSPQAEPMMVGNNI
jgi:hypothetical protein